MINIVNILTDSRMPFYFPYTILKRLRLKAKYKIQDVEKIFISITFDIEKDPVNDLSKSASDFIPSISNILSKEKKSTFFVQGDMVAELSTLLRKLKGFHEIGLHGFSHEVWGDKEWWNNKEPIKLDKKKELLEKSIKLFSKNKLPKPKSFRCPFMIVNDETFDVLRDYGFSVDSSLPSYLGVLPIPVRLSNAGLFSIPVSGNPVPKISFSKVIPYIYYEIFNVERMCKFDQNQIIEFVKLVCSVQLHHGHIPHLVFLGHPWEFTEMDQRKFSYCSKENYKMFQNLFSIIENNFNVEYYTIQNLAKKFVM